MELNKLATKIPQAVLDQIPSVMEKFKIDTPLRLAHFLAQCAHESGNFKVTTENLNYSKEGLMKVFGKYFPNEVLAKQYEKKPNTIANRVYASRMGNGDENSQDGSKFKGRGFIQLTGKQNYTAFDRL
jgi:putative chitinase